MKRVLTSAVLGLGLLGASQLSMAVWVDGQCGTGTPCIEYYDGSDWYHFNSEGDHTGDWHGSPLGGDLEYCGVTTLSCDGVIPVEAECELCLDGQVRKCEDSNGDWRIGIKIVDGQVNPIDFFCNFISVEGFPWYAGPNDYHGPYNEDCEVGILYTQPLNLIGSIGNINVPTVGVSGGHIHDVSYNNIDSFSFNGEIVVGFPHSGTDCSVVGNLELQPTDDTLTIY